MKKNPSCLYFYCISVHWAGKTARFGGLPKFLSSAETQLLHHLRLLKLVMSVFSLTCQPVYAAFQNKTGSLPASHWARTTPAKLLYAARPPVGQGFGTVFPGSEFVLYFSRLYLEWRMLVVRHSELLKLARLLFLAEFCCAAQRETAFNQKKSASRSVIVNIICCCLSHSRGQRSAAAGRQSRGPDALGGRRQPELGSGLLHPTGAGELFWEDPDTLLYCWAKEH